VDNAVLSNRSTFTRRTFLESSAVAAGVLMLGVELASGDVANAADARFAPDAFIRIDSRGRVTLIMPQTEMGQGSTPGLP
jgi:isoquinoline 1-oxidoreductase beta subunit